MNIEAKALIIDRINHYKKAIKALEDAASVSINGTSPLVASKNDDDGFFDLLQEMGILFCKKTVESLENKLNNL